MLRKLKSVAHGLSHRPDSGAKREIGREEAPEANRTGNPNGSVCHPLGADGPSAPEPPGLPNRELENDTAPGILPNLDFEAETTAESFFQANPAEAALGTFRKVDTVRWDHTEADWNLEEFDFEPPEKLADRRMSRAPLVREHQQASDATNPDQKAIRISIHEIRRTAAGRHWLSPKSSRALTRLDEGNAKLDRSDKNALIHLLERCSRLPDLNDHILFIRKFISH